MGLKGGESFMSIRVLIKIEVHIPCVFPIVKKTAFHT